MQVPVDSHPLGPLEHGVGPGGCAAQAMVASHLNIANSPPAPKDFLVLLKVSRKGLVSVKLWQTPSLKDASKDFIMFLWGHTLPYCLVSAMLTSVWDASGLCKHHWPQGKESLGCSTPSFLAFSMSCQVPAGPEKPLPPKPLWPLRPQGGALSLLPPPHLLSKSLQPQGPHSPQVGMRVHPGMPAPSLLASLTKESRHLLAS